MKNVVPFVALAVALAVPGAVMAGGGSVGRTLFITSAVEHPDGTATFPLHRGTSHGRTVWYILLDSSDGKDAAALGINQSSKLNNARGTAAVQKVSVVNGVVDFPATVDFAPVRQVVPGPQGFPPAVAMPGAIGEPGYSPLWDVHPGQWTAAAVAAGQNVRQTDRSDIRNLVDKGVVTGPGGAPFGPAGFIVNCPIVSQDE